MVAQGHLPGPGRSRSHSFCWMKATLLCVKDWDLAPPLSRAPWQETGVLYSPTSTCPPGHLSKGVGGPWRTPLAFPLVGGASLESQVLK